MNQRQITKALSSATFAPGKPGPLKVIADVGNINYYIRRAMEFLTLSLTALTKAQRVKYFDSALGMVALAKVKTQNEVDKQKQAREVCGESDSVSTFGILGDIRDRDRSSESEGPISKETQSWPQITNPPGKNTQGGTRGCTT
ncbi:MAG: hypothetical protein V3V68_05185 [Nitrosomonadaceae bacterium]